MTEWSPSGGHSRVAEPAPEEVEHRDAEVSREEGGAMFWSPIGDQEDQA